MKSKIEYVDLCGLRLDGRRPQESRRIQIEMGVNQKSDGSCLFQQGLTKIIAAVYGPHEASQRIKPSNEGAVITCEIHTAPFSAGERKTSGLGDRRSMEIAASIRETFENVVVTQVAARSEISIYLQILQSDGGVRSACVNAVSLALIDAGIPMKDFVVACSAAHIDGFALLDPNHVEEASSPPQIFVSILPNSNEIVHCHFEPKIGLDYLRTMTELAMSGCRQIYDALKAEVRTRTQEMVESKGVVSL